jgi:uncharacterized protein YjbI with pentapeptide repeats
MSNVDWIKAGVDLLGAIISGVFVGLVVYLLDERRAKRDRRLSDFRIAANWEVTEPKPSLRNFDLTGANLSGYNLSKANLENAILEKTSLWGTNLDNANLRITNFRNAKLVGVTFTNVVAFYSDFSNALIRKRSESGKIWIPDFSNTNFRNCIFKKATIKGVIFHNVNFIEADFTGAIVEDCDFTNADLTDAKWQKVRNVERCIWVNVKVSESRYFPKWLWEEIQSQNAKPVKKVHSAK